MRKHSGGEICGRKDKHNDGNVGSIAKEHKIYKNIEYIRIYIWKRDLFGHVGSVVPLTKAPNASQLYKFVLFFYSLL